MKLRWIILPVLAGAVYFAFFGGEYSLWDVRRLQKEKDTELQQLQQTRLDNARLRAHADSLEKDSATLERVAREKYGLVKPGERLYRFADKRTLSADSARAAVGAANTSAAAAADSARTHR